MASHRFCSNCTLTRKEVLLRYQISHRARGGSIASFDPLAKLVMISEPFYAQSAPYSQSHTKWVVKDENYFTPNYGNLFFSSLGSETTKR